MARSHLRQVIDELTTTPVDSPFEWEVVAAIVERGLRPVTGFPWRCPDGRVILLDVAFPGAWVAATSNRPPAERADCRCRRCRSSAAGPGP